MILRDIRNSFAHGNFKICYDIRAKDLYFVLSPQRKDFSVDVPIVISQKSLKHAIMKPIIQLNFSIMQSGEEFMNNDKLNNLLKTLLLPTQMLKIADHYLEEVEGRGQQLHIDEKRYNLIQYILLVTQITYEQDDYYNIIGKDSSLFQKISLIRNAIAHDGFIFAEHAQSVKYEDRDRKLDESLGKSVASLLIANNIKQTIISVLNNGHKQESINCLREKLKEYFEAFFCNENEHIDFLGTTFNN